ncbi:hypothetical protein J8L98_21520 [Pseudoalteromonas sp. MMG013]|uniref:hypothetical protein n=1 Tax=Pseudoalteromonas sp. MMG013 TaxID=2822687 RepID=UPI001B36BCBF|nr:hypothetical protein [Pseudoalteromonas sp. MMG013]MBQ4864274.1 hypothetical protein [Pseudoalteromonas sp. MMG013]
MTSKLKLNLITLTMTCCLFPLANTQQLLNNGAFEKASQHWSSSILTNNVSISAHEKFGNIAELPPHSSLAQTIETKQLFHEQYWLRFDAKLHV